MRVLIAGCGYVGAKLAAVWSADPAVTVFALRRSLAPPPAPGVVPLACDLVNGSLAELPSGLDRLIFAAAPAASTAAAYEDTYLRALGRMLEFMERRGAPGARLLLTSSTAVYGQNNGEWVDEGAATLPQSPTSAVIVQGEKLLRAGDVAVRLGGIYGPGRTSFIRTVRDGTIVVNPQHSAYTNRIHRDDAAGILKFCAGLPEPAAVYNGVDCEVATRATVAAWLAGELGVPLQTTAAAEESSFLRGNKRVSNGRLLAAGYRFLYPSFREGYRELLRE